MKCKWVRWARWAAHWDDAEDDDDDDDDDEGHPAAGGKVSFENTGGTGTDM